MVPAEEIGPGRIQVALVAHPRDLFRHVEQRVRDLARHHVDFVGVGNGDDHLGVLGIRLLKHVGERRVADDRPRIHRVGEPLHHRPVAVDHGHVVRFVGELTGDAGADLSGTAHDDLHGPFSLSELPLLSVGLGVSIRRLLALLTLEHPERAQLAVERRAFHADELGGARDIAAKTVDLRVEIIPLEQSARFAQRHCHDVGGTGNRLRLPRRRPECRLDHVCANSAVGGCRRHDKKPLHEVAELAHVAGPVEGLKHRHPVAGDLVRRQACALRRLLNEEARQLGDIFAPLPQRRHFDGRDLQTVIQVFAKSTLRYFRRHVARRRRHDADVDFDLLRAAFALERVGLERARDLALGLERHVGYFVEEERAAVRTLEGPDLA